PIGRRRRPMAAYEPADRANWRRLHRRRPPGPAPSARGLLRNEAGRLEPPLLVARPNASAAPYEPNALAAVWFSHGVTSHFFVIGAVGFHGVACAMFARVISLSGVWQGTGT